MRTVMVVEFKVVEVTHISIRTRRPPEEVTVENRLQQAIQSLDSLNDQIVQFIFAPTSTQSNGVKTDSDGGQDSALSVTGDAASGTSGLPHDAAADVVASASVVAQREALHTSMALMRRLLVDAQAKFRRMMEENKALASRIDGDIQNAHQEVSLLRAELADTNKRITQISNSVVVPSSTHSAVAGSSGSTGDRIPSPAMSRDPGSGRSSPAGRASPAPRKESPSKTASFKKPSTPLAKKALRMSGGRDSSPASSSLDSTDLRLDEEDEDLSTADSACQMPQMGASPAACDRCRTCSHDPLTLSSRGSSIDELGGVVLGGDIFEGKLSSLETQNRHLSQLIGSLQRDLEQAQRMGLDRPGSAGAEGGISLPHIEKLETELKHAKDALAALKQDRKRLKAEKFDLLNQMKQLYGTLEDKEKELRDFIRNYELRMKESDENLKLLVQEREESEREKWNILKHARDEAERSVALCAQLGLKEAQVKQLQEELSLIREKLGYMSDMDPGRGVRSNGYRSPSATSTHTHNGRESSNTPTPTMGSDPTSSYAGTPTITVDSDNSPNHAGKESQRPSLPGLSRSAEEIYNSSESSDAGSKKSRRRREGAKGTWGSISRVFSRGKSRKSLEPGFYETVDQGQRSSWSPGSSLCASPLTEDSYPEKIRLLEEAQGLPMERWKAATVLAWLEVSLGMPQYGPACAENIKSGKVILELSDPELEGGLGITNVMHRRKLRLAIEEHRDPALCRFPKICLLSHQWVVEEWLPSLGLFCYADSFAAQMVDGRVLETLTKKDLEKYLNVSRKFHQVSIMHAIQLLRMVKFDKQILMQRRSHSETMDVDPLVWTNQRFIKWAKSIDLVEYAENLRESGVHGALVVLEPSFQADTMATALGIPSSKNIIRRHLTTELENLIQPARMSLEAEALVNSKRGDKRFSHSLHGVASTTSSSTGSLGRSFLRSASSKGALDRPDKRRSSMRGSLTRVLGLKFHNEPSSPPVPPDTTSTAHLRHQASVQQQHLHHSHQQTVTVTTVSSPQVPKTTEILRRQSRQMETLTVTPV